MIPAIRVSQVDIGPDEESLVLKVLRSGQLAQGPMVAELEANFAQLAGTDHAVAVSSGTTALVAALQSLQLTGVIEAGDEVLTTPFTFVATINAALMCGLTVRFADIGEDFCLDPEVTEARRSERTRVLIPVHLYGLPADMATLAPWAEEHGVFVVEDAAQALGATVGDRPVGSYGLSCFSLYATKNITAGEGGVVATDHSGLADTLRTLRNQGMQDRYEYVVVGQNYRMTDLQAAVAVGQLRRFETIAAARRRNAERLMAVLDGVAGLVTPFEPDGRRSAWHQFTVRITGEARLSREDLIAALAERGIGAGVYYPRAVYDYPCFRDHPQIRRDPTPRATAFAGQVLSLPIHPLVGDDGIDRIAETIRELLDG